MPDEKLEDLCGSIPHEVGGQHGEQALYGLPDGLVGCSGLLIGVQAESVLSEEGVRKGPEGLINLAKFSQPCDNWQVLCFNCTRSCGGIDCIREEVVAFCCKSGHVLTLAGNIMDCLQIDVCGLLVSKQQRGSPFGTGQYVSLYAE